MARQSANGLRRVYIDTDLYEDVRVRKLIRHQGGKAIAVYTLLLCSIYNTNGYYIRWDEGLSFTCSDILGCDEAYISEVIKCCVMLGLFNKALYDSDRVLTSEDIQATFARSCAITKKRGVIDRYRLVDYTVQAPEEPTTMPAPSDIASTPYAYPGVTPPPTALRPIKELAAECLASQAWIESVCITSRLSIEQVQDLMQAFLSHLVASGYGDRKTIFDFKKHFINYIRKHNEHNTTGYAAASRINGHPVGGQGRLGLFPGGTDASEGYETSF